MVPGKYDITIYRGGTFHIEATGSDKFGQINFASTYASAKMYIQRAWFNTNDSLPSEPLYEFSTENGIITLGSEVVTLHIAAPGTWSLPFNSGVYNLKLITADAEPIEDIFLEGVITVKSGATP